MNRVLLLSALLLSLAIGCLEKETPNSAEEDKVIHFREEDKEMNAAMEKARATLDSFTIRFQTPKEGDSDFTLKAAITDENGTEHFWITNFSVEDTIYTGFISNTPTIVKSVREGQLYSFGPSQVSDWAFDINGVRQGSFTLKVMLERMPKDEADYYRTMVGWK